MTPEQREEIAYQAVECASDPNGPIQWREVDDLILLMERLLSPEVCLCATILMPDGYIVRGHRHNDCISTLRGMTRYESTKSTDCTQGFLTSKGRFVDRVEGAKLQVNAGIVSACPELPYHNGELYSEDLY